jgi:hypothetical protein
MIPSVYSTCTLMYLIIGARYQSNHGHQRRAAKVAMTFHIESTFCYTQVPLVTLVETALNLNRLH